MRPKLLKSFIVVCAFWFFVTTLWWTLATPDVNHAALVSLQKLLPFLNLQVGETPNILTAWRDQITVLAYWTVPLLFGTALFVVAGIAVAWSFAWKTHAERETRERGRTENFRTIEVTKGVLPKLRTWARDDVTLGADEGSALATISDAERALLEEVLGTLSAHGDGWAGEGVTVTLVEHAAKLAELGLARPRAPGLCAIVAAAHELGKLGAYARKNDQWVAVKSHDRVAAQILTSLPAWYAMPERERDAVYLAVKYYSTPKLVPPLNGDDDLAKLATDLLYSSGNVQQTVLTEEKQKTLEKANLPDVIFDAFIQALPMLAFQNKGQPKGVRAVAWKLKSRVYMMEIILRETIMAKLPEDIRGALKPNPRDRVKLQPFTYELLKALDARGWLVRSHEGLELDVKEALWVVQAGKLSFRGVIAIEVPAEYMQRLPRDDSMYEVSITSSLFTPSNATAEVRISKEDLLGSVLKPSSASTAPPAASTPSAPKQDDLEI